MVRLFWHRTALYKPTSPSARTRSEQMCITYRDWSSPRRILRGESATCDTGLGGKAIVRSRSLHPASRTLHPGHWPTKPAHGSTKLDKTHRRFVALPKKQLPTQPRLTPRAKRQFHHVLSPQTLVALPTDNSQPPTHPPLNKIPPPRRQRQNDISRTTNN